MICRPSCARRRRSGVAAVELAVLLPFLGFLAVITTDFARIFYYAVTVTNCARNGAVYASDSVQAAQSPYTSVQQAALADASNISPAPNVTATYTTSGNGTNYVDCSVTYTFQTFSNFPGVPNNVNLVRTVRMQVAPVLPNF